jgi:hypothetical protein
MNFPMVRLSQLATSGKLFVSLMTFDADILCASFRAPEALFQPAFLGLEAAGIHETT